MKTGKCVGDVEEEDLLEDVWLGLVSRVEEQPFTNRSYYTNFGTGSIGGDSIVGSRVRQQRPLVGNVYRWPSSQLAKSTSYYNDDDDDASEFSQLTGSTTAFAPHPTTTVRMIRKVDAVDMDDDFRLEEAFIDAEIYQAKERRHFAGYKRKKKGSEKSKYFGGRKLSDKTRKGYPNHVWKQEGKRINNYHEGENNH